MRKIVSFVGVFAFVACLSFYSSYAGKFPFQCQWNCDTVQLTQVPVYNSTTDSFVVTVQIKCDGDVYNDTPCGALDATILIEKAVLVPYPHFQLVEYNTKHENAGIPCGGWSFLSAGRFVGFKTLYGPGTYRWTYFTSTGCMDSDYVNVP